MLRRILDPRGPRLDLPVAAIDRGGAVTLRDGSTARTLRLTAAGIGESDQGRVQEALAGFIAALQPGDALQWYVDSRPVPVDVESRVSREIHAVLRTGRRRRGPRAPHTSLVLADRLRATLAALGLESRLLDGPAVSRLLLTRLFSAAVVPDEHGLESVGSLDPDHDRAQAGDAAQRLGEHLRRAAVDFGDDRLVRIGGGIEQTLQLASDPTAAPIGWLAPLLAVELPASLSVTVTRAHASDALELAVLLTVRAVAPAADAVELATAVDAAVRDAAARSSVRLDRGEFVQRALWPATLPLALPVGAAGHSVSPRAAARSTPLLTADCGSPDGIVLALGPRGTVEHLDPWDPEHRQPGIAIAGAGAETAAALVLVRLALSGVAVVAVDLDGALAEALGDHARVVAVGDAAELLALPGGVPREPLVVVPASEGEALPVAAAAWALLSDRATGTQGAFAIAGAERLVAAPRGADWLCRAAARARRDGACVVAVTRDLTRLAAAGALPALPVRLVLGHDPGKAEALRSALRLSEAEGALVARASSADDLAPPAVWLNGDRGRAPVRLIPDLPVAA
jgi:hypothetical protein